MTASVCYRPDKFMRWFLVIACCVSMVEVPPRTETVTPHQRQLIDELLTVVHADQLWSQIFDVATSQLKMGLDSRRLARFRTLAASKINGNDVLRDILTKVYFKYYSDDDVEAMIAFYKTPVGQKISAVMPNVMAETTRAAEERLGPEFTSILDQIYAEDEQQRKTIRDLKSIGTAVEAWALSEGSGNPETMEMPALIKKLEIVSPHLPAIDAWGHSYAYASSTDKKHYRIVCAGSDGLFEPSSLRVTSEMPAETRYTELPGADIIYDDGRFLQLPKAWHPEAESRSH